MTDSGNPVRTHFSPLTTHQRTELRARMERYRAQLEDNGYDVAIAEGSNGFFAGVLVSDEERGRVGFLEENGAVTWLDGSAGGVGALSSAIAQNPIDEQDSAIGVPDGVNFE